MQITVDIPEQLAGRIIPDGVEPPRATLEALALEGYRTQRLSEMDITQMLGFETDAEVRSFLQKHEVLQRRHNPENCHKATKSVAEAIEEIRRLREGTSLDELSIKEFITEGRKY